MTEQQIEAVRKLKIGYCVSCQNLFCKKPAERKKPNGNCARWSNPQL